MACTSPILVTGAAGCIGAWVIARLAGAGRKAVAFDLSGDRRRLRLALAGDQADAVTWETGDIAADGTLNQVVERHGIGAIVHLAALQIPFCFADPVAGARVNVVGTAQVFETARRHGLTRLVYASSIAALTPPGHDGPTTLYGVTKVADEGFARLYWQDWQVPSIGLRPHTVYGPGRDQGRTSAPTKAMLAAAAGRPFAMPYNGTLRMQHVHEVADAVIRCIDAEPRGAFVGDLEGVRATIPEIVAAIKQVVPDADIAVPEEHLPSSVDLNDHDLRALVGDWPRVSLADGTRMTIDAFRGLLSRGLVNVAS
jgi:nucleoside-diphosphate-sugar epimerase